MSSCNLIYSSINMDLIWFSYHNYKDQTKINPKITKDIVKHVIEEILIILLNILFVLPK